MSDWEEVLPGKVTEKNIRDFAGLQNGMIPGAPKENPATNLTELEKELTRPNISPAVHKILMEEKAKLSKEMDSGWSEVANEGGWEEVKSKGLYDDVPYSEQPGALETAAHMVSGMPGWLGGGFNYLSTLAATGGDTEAAMAVKQGSEQRINDAIQYQPRSNKGKDYVEGVGKAFQKGIDTFGEEVLPQTIRAIPLIGEDLSKDIDPEAVKAFGKAYAEMMLDVAPVPFVGKGGKGKASHVPETAGMLDAPPKMEPVLERPMPEATVAHADDFAAINPYDVGGHVTEAKAGRPAMIDNPQGELFGGQHLEQAKAGPEGSLVHEPLMREEVAPLERYTPEPVNPAMAEAMKKAEVEKAHKEVAAIAETSKERHFDAIQDLEVARRAGELDFQHARDVVKDKTLLDQDKTIMMRGYLRNGDLKSSLTMIGEHHPNSAYRTLAKYMTDKVDGLKVKLHDESIVNIGDRRVTGYYDPTTHTVGFSGLGGTSPHTVLHELVHAATSHFINTKLTDLRVVGLKNLFTNLQKESGMQKFPGIVNTKEFVAEAFSNPKFQEFLKNTRIDNKTMWRRFVDGVKSIFGLKGETPVSTAFEQAIDLGQQIIEAQTGKGADKAQLVRAGMPNRLADLMSQAPHDLPSPKTNRNGDIAKVAGKLPGLEHAVSDFAFYDKPINEIIEMAKTAPDIPEGVIEKFAQQMQGGALFESLKTRNPVVKYTYERITRAFQEAAHNVKTNLTDPKTGLKTNMRTLSTVEKGQIHSKMMLAEGQYELTSTHLAEAGFNEKQIAYFNRYREISNKFFEDINKRRVEAGLTPMDKRVSHIAANFLGDFSRMVHNADGKVVGRISGSTRGELNKVTKFMQDAHPEWIFDKEHYNKLGGEGRRPGDRFTGMMEAINFISKADGDVAALLDSYKGYLQQNAINFLNATKHAKAKVKDAGGIHGSEGHKEWLSAEKNAEEGMKAQLTYFEQGYEWMAMEKAVADLKPLLGDEGVLAQTPRAVEYANKYIEHAQGRNQGPVADVANWTANMIGKGTGLGHTNLMKMNANAKHLIMQKFMGVFNIPFSITQLTQPLQTQPALLGLLQKRGLEFSTVSGQLKAANTYLHSMLEPHGAGKLSDFEKSALKYADEMNIFDVKMADHTKDINVSPLKEGWDKMADLNITVPEHFTRGMSFLFYSHILRDAGIPMKDIFGAAENMTNMSMVNYHKIERPMGYAKLGWLGDVASTLTRYKHNQWSQLALYGREAVKEGHYSPLARFTGTSLAFGGMMGFFAFQEADAIYQLLSEKVLGKPDSLTNVVLESKAPEVLTHGISSLLGLDMTSRFSNANAIPDSIPKALMPYGSAVMDMVDSTGRWVIDPKNEFKAKQMAKAIAPQSMSGPMENMFFTEKQKNGKNLYINSTDGPDVGKGRVERTDDQMMLRNFGFRNVQESKKLAKNYSDGQIAKGRANLGEKLINKTKYDILGKSMTDKELSELLQTRMKRYVELGQNPERFTNELVSWSQSRQLSQSKQILLRNAAKGFSGAYNIMESRE